MKCKEVTEVAVGRYEVFCMIGEERETGQEEGTRWEDGQKLFEGVGEAWR